MHFKNIHISRFIKVLLSLLALVFITGFDASAKDSKLSSGIWYKMSISSTGMYKLSYSDLKGMGVDVAHINPKNIRIYHNGGGVLPKVNKDYYPDDLYEIPIFVYGEDDGVFNSGDYVLFYARGPVVWNYNRIKQYYHHVKNPYTDNTYVFMTIGDEAGRRIQTASTPAGSVTNTVSEFVDYQVKDVDETNINNMGCTWFFDRFDMTLERNYEFSFSNLIATKEVKMRTAMASRNNSSASMTFRYNGNILYTKSFPNYSTYDYARYDSACLARFRATGSPVNINVKYARASSSSVAWMDYISMNVWRYLKMAGDVMQFRNPECANTESIYEYQIQNASNSVKVWDVTDPINPEMMNTTLSSSTLSFKVKGNIKNQFVAYNGNSFNKPNYVGKVANQNLHALKDIDYLIITHPKFQEHAERLKEIHSRIDDLVIEIVQPQYIYNEFSCGALDVAGIRNFIKMLYKNSGADHSLKYVLLFGDASYAYKNSSECFIPTWESFCSWDINASMVTDDFYVCLDDDEGDMNANNSILDIPIGRMPVSLLKQATIAIDKIEAYLEKTSATMNDWRNVVTLMCDDESGQFIANSEYIADNIHAWGGDVIVDKIYLDAYNQVATASGQRCPEFNEALSNRMEKGSLVVNYNGHGGEIGLADERILTIDDIKSWTNMPLMPLFVTATCEFSRFDDHTRTSAGEMVFTSDKGGAIAMITTARTTGGSGSLLNRTYQNMFKMKDGEYPTMGEIFYHTKQDYSQYTKVFVLFGDPALCLAYPKNNVVLKKINGKPVSPAYDTLCLNDTLKALGTIELQGEVTDNFGERMTDFNGIVRVKVYDKENTYQTKGDNGYAVKDFKLRNSLLYDGRAMVEAGVFTTSFMLPKDINYSYGKGLISFYATDYQTDANGQYANIIVGGYDDTAIPDVKGPEARIFIDDTLFINGGMTSESPVFLAYVRDEHGINMTGSGIGHDITATVTGATNKTYNLNSYYDTPLTPDGYGTIAYRFYDLNEGKHHVVFRVWDIYNNSTTRSIDFNVVKSSDIIARDAYNVPNPMSNYTCFYFDHNQKGNIDVTINIYNVSGQLVKVINESRYGTETRVNPIVWDGTSDGGQPLANGVYIYNIVITSGNNEKEIKFSKLIIAR